MVKLGPRAKFVVFFSVAIGSPTWTPHVAPPRFTRSGPRSTSGGPCPGPPPHTLKASDHAGREEANIRRRKVLTLPLDPELGQVAVEDLGGDGRDGLAPLDRRKLQPIEDAVRQGELAASGFPSGGTGSTAGPRLGFQSNPPALPFRLGLVLAFRLGLVLGQIAVRRFRLRCRPDQRGGQTRNPPLIRHDREPP